MPVSLCFLDVASPSLTDVLPSFGSARVVIVPLLLSAGFHVQTDIPAIVSGRPGVRVAGHVGPDPLIVDALAERLAEVARGPAASTVLAAIASSRESARAEVDTAAALLAARLGRPVSVLPLSSGFASAIASLPDPIEVAVYLLAEGGFLSSLRAAVGGRGAVAAPIGVHPALVSLIWSRYDAAVQ